MVLPEEKCIEYWGPLLFWHGCNKFPTTDFRLFTNGKKLVITGLCASSFSPVVPAGLKVIELFANTPHGIPYGTAHCQPHFDLQGNGDLLVSKNLLCYKSKQAQHLAVA